MSDSEYGAAGAASTPTASTPSTASAVSNRRKEIRHLVRFLKDTVPNLASQLELGEAALSDQSDVQNELYNAIVVAVDRAVKKLDISGAKKN